jgi:hypothetical protein
MSELSRLPLRRLILEPPEDRGEPPCVNCHHEWDDHSPSTDASECGLCSCEEYEPDDRDEGPDPDRERELKREERNYA